MTLAQDKKRQQEENQIQAGLIELIVRSLNDAELSALIVELINSRNDFLSTPAMIIKRYAEISAKHVKGGDLIVRNGVTRRAVNFELLRGYDQPTPPKCGWVYFIRSEKDGYVKIGRSATSPKRRLLSLQIGSSSGLTLIGAIRTARDYDLELQLHTEYQDYRAHGEWFELGDVDLELIKRTFTHSWVDGSVLD